MNSGNWKCACLLLVGLLPVAVQAEGVPARLEWQQQIVLSTPESGVIEKLSVVVGDRVQHGQELLRLDTRVQQAQLQQADAAVAETELLLAEAERERDRTLELYDRTLLADHDLQLAQIAYARARTQFAAARAQRAQVQQQLEYRVLRAPWAGRVIAVPAQPGQTVVSRLEPVPLITLAGEGGMLARAQVRPEQLVGLNPGLALEVEVAGRRYAGVVNSLGWPADEVAGEPRAGLAVHFTVPADTVLWPGMAASIQLP